jgi:predicted membrane-bound spermidine synthase
MRSAALRVCLLLFGSGYCALVYQTAWLRMLRHVFGASTLASAAVLAIFMAGLGFGGLLLGPRADRRRSPLELYAKLEMGVAVSAGLSPWLVALVGKLYIALGGSESLGPTGGTAVRLALSALVLGIPTFLMGGTLPAAARAAEQASDQGRRVVGLLYAVNTLGAVCGTLLTTFYALERLGIRKTVWIAALLNLLIALIARNVARGMDTDGTEKDTDGTDRDTDGSTDEDTDRLPARGAAPGWLVIVAAALVGFAFLLMELVWYRMLSPLLGGSSYTFGLILALALLGIGAGGLLYAAGATGRRPTLAAFAVTCALEALLLALPFALGDRIAVAAALLRPLGGAGFLALVLTWSAVTSLVVLPAALVAGYQFPLLIALLGGGRDRVAREIGVTYAANTVGAIIGSIAGGFGLLPLLTAPGVWRLVVALLLLLAVAAVAADLGRGAPRRAAGLPLALAAAGLLLCLAPGPSAFWRHSPIGAGRVDTARWHGPNDIRAFAQERRGSVTWQAEGVESSVAIDVGDEIAFLVSGKADGSARSDAPTQVMSGLVGAILHPQPRRALVIGLGTGSSAGWLAAVPGIERVDVVELEPAILRVARECAPVNRDVLKNPKVHVIIGDGRELLLTTAERYDIIFSEPSNPYRAGIASLFTEDFYRAVRQRLRPGGIFLQWLQGYELDAQVVGLVYGTLGSVFPAVESWQVHSSDLLLAASAGPLSHDVARIRARVAQEPFRSALAETWGVSGAEGFYAGYVASDAFTRAVAQGSGRDTAIGRLDRINTDDRPILEFGFARNLGRLGLFQIADLRALVRARGESRPALAGTLDWARVEELRAARLALWSGPPDPPASPDPTSRSAAVSPEAARRILARQAYGGDDLGKACTEWFAQPAGPGSPLDTLLVGECLAAQSDPRTPAYAAGLRATNPVEADLLLGIWNVAGGHPGEAAARLTAGFAAARTWPWTHTPLLRRAMLLTIRLAREEPAVAPGLYAALSRPFSVRLLEEDRLRARIDIARSAGRDDLCTDALAPFEGHAPWEERFLTYRAACYQRTGNPLREEALDDLARFRADAAPELSAGLPPPGRPAP